MSNTTKQNTDQKTHQEEASSNYNELLNARKETREEIKKEAAKQPEIKWLTENSRKFLSSGYLTEGTTPEERIREIALRAEEILKIDGFADKFYGYMAEGYYSLASPVWSNFGKRRGLPISCFGSHIDDDMGDILYTQSEVGMMSKLGGGTSGYFGKLRHRGAPVKNNGESSGAVHIMQLFEKMVDVVSQGSVRRGRFSPYLPIDHADIHEFLEIGTEGNPIQELTHGVTVGDQWMQEMIDGDTDKRAIWAKVLQRRGEIGYPYIFFKDNANNKAPDVYQDKNHEIYASNLCSEIMLPTNDRWSFVCVLSSINLLHYDKWKDTDAVETMVYFLDAVLEEFITKLEVYRDSTNRDDRQTFMFMEKAYNFAKENRALGMGALGWHSLLQSKMLGFDSQEAFNLNSEIFKTINDKYGHCVGDDALKLFAATAKQNFSASVDMGRLGGEEFLFIFQGVDVSETVKHLETFSQSLKDASIKALGGEIKLTFSAGVLLLTEAQSISSVLEKTDAALYEAKETGRDKIVVFTCL